MRLLLAAALVLLGSPSFAAMAIPADTIIRSAVDGFIRPAFLQFAEESTALKTDVSALCATPGGAALSAARERFKSTVLAFSRVEFVRIGPLGVGDRLERLLFWPDSKGIALKQVQAALAEKDVSVTEPATLQGKSVALQGLVALEFLLFGTGSEALGTGEGSFRCGYAASATGLVAGLAATVDAEWRDDGARGAVAHMLDPQPTADDYRTQTEVLEKLTATLIHGTETIRDQRLMPIIGATEGKPKPKSALFWRSNMTVPAIAANFAGLHDFFVAAKYPEAMGETNGWVANGAVFEFENAARAAAEIANPIETVVTATEGLQVLRYLVIITGSLDTLLGDNLAAALDLSVGFSQLDGD